MVYVPSKVTNHRPVWHRFYQLQLHLLRTLCITVAVLCGTVGPCSVKPTREPRWRNKLAQCSTVVKLEKLGECGFSSFATVLVQYCYIAEAEASRSIAKRALQSSKWWSSNQLDSLACQMPDWQHDNRNSPALFCRGFIYDLSKHS